ncbi:MAG: hypothetical protein U0835_13890 [Isosphaeraceae bacterium]
MQRGRLGLLAGIALLLLGQAPANEEGFQTIFNGKDKEGWVTNTGKPLPAANVQADGLNPHKAGGYLVVHAEVQRLRAGFRLQAEQGATRACSSAMAT